MVSACRAPSLLALAVLGLSTPGPIQALDTVRLSAHALTTPSNSSCTSGLTVGCSVDDAPHQAQAAAATWPDATDGFTLEDLWDFYFDCESLGQRPIHDHSVWMLLRGVYQGTVGPARASILQPLSTENGFFVDYEVRHTPDKGRGLFAARDIQKGELVYTSSKQMAKFHSGSDFRRFLQAIPPELACDVMMWAYVEDLKVDGPTIGVELDEGSLFNDGGDALGNVGCDDDAALLYPHGCDLNYFALRDIQEGEELLCIYSEFAIGDGWGEFGL